MEQVALEDGEMDAQKRARLSRRAAGFDDPRDASVGLPEAVRIRMLGGFRVSVGGHAVGGAWRLRKAANLVKLLALAPGHRMHRERA
ncbi:MAG: hypothetical protein CYG60_24830 [Actinobacteria bacterium]|nr:MAG: hypothetical protein CYG60_24830 [Actinomycetota bacterium]